MWTLIIGGSICLAVLLLPLFLKSNDNGSPTICWTESISYFGCLGTWLGLIIVFIQTHGLQKSTDKVTKAVNTSNQQMMKILSISDVSRHAQMLTEIHSYIRTGKWELCHLRMLEILSILSDISIHNDHYGISKDDINNMISSVKEDIRNLNDSIIGKSSINPSFIANNLVELTQFLDSICSRLKQSHDYA